MNDGTTRRNASSAVATVAARALPTGMVCLLESLPPDILATAARPPKRDPGADAAVGALSRAGSDARRSDDLARALRPRTAFPELMDANATEHNCQQRWP